MTAEETDYTGKMGPLDSGRKWEMYSYTRPAWVFWNAFANGLKNRGFTDEQIKAALTGKGVRWMLDKDLEMIEDVAHTMAGFYQK